MGVPSLLGVPKISNHLGVPFLLIIDKNLLIEMLFNTEKMFDLCFAIPSVLYWRVSHSWNSDVNISDDTSVSNFE